MEYPSFDDLRSRYQALYRQLELSELTDDQFLDEVQKLNTRDSAGNIWGIEPRSGQFMVYTEQGWIYQEPPAEKSKGANIQETLVKNPGCRRILGIVALVLPLVSAFLWFAYSSLAPGSEGWDCITPLIIGGLPFLLLIFQRPVDSLLQPLQALRRPVPKLVLRGAALALPFVLGIICSQTAGTEYSGLRLSLIICMLGAYALLRDPEVQQ